MYSADHLQVQPARLGRGGPASTHDSPNNTGGRDIFNELNTKDPEEGLSYYQKQQLKYGRSRRGSTSIAGAWEQVFEGGAAGEGDGVDGGQADAAAAAEFEAAEAAAAADAEVRRSPPIPNGVYTHTSPVGATQSHSSPASAAHSSPAGSGSGSPGSRQQQADLQALVADAIKLAQQLGVIP
jgi:hypothetical protein